MGPPPGLSTGAAEGSASMCLRAAASSAAPAAPLAYERSEGSSSCGNVDAREAQ